MGGGPSIPASPPPPAPAPIDYDKMYGAATKAAIAQMREQEDSLKRLYPQMTALQMETARNLSRELDNEYLAKARGVIGEELQSASAPNRIEAELQRQAEEELALGRSLTPEQLRNATQSARNAFASRGLATSNAAAGAEILNRDAMAEQRIAERRGFAGSVNQMDLARRQRRLGLAVGYGDLDPYARALGPAFGLGTATMGQGTALIGNTFANATQTAGNVESFNANMAANRYNSWANNNAALQGAGMQAGAASRAGTMGMVGAGVGAAAGLAVVGIAI
jgi:hypothetical protein